MGIGGRAGVVVGLIYGIRTQINPNIDFRCLGLKESELSPLRTTFNSVRLIELKVKVQVL